MKIFLWKLDLVGGGASQQQITQIEITQWWDKQQPVNISGNEKSLKNEAC